MYGSYLEEFLQDVWAEHECDSECFEPLTTELLVLHIRLHSACSSPSVAVGSSCDFLRHPLDVVQ